MLLYASIFAGIKKYLTIYVCRCRHACISTCLQNICIVAGRTKLACQWEIIISLKKNAVFVKAQVNPFEAYL